MKYKNKKGFISCFLFVSLIWLLLGNGPVYGARLAGDKDVTPAAPQSEPKVRNVSPVKPPPKPPVRGRPVRVIKKAPNKSAVEKEKSAPKEAKTDPRYVTIDFDNVDMAVFIKFISELTGKNFVINNAVKGKVTIISPTKITIKEAYKVFESVLEVHGFTTVPAGSIIKIVPSIQARSKDIET
ncbi:MAG: hypothetical protein JRI43_06375, partial [Deltaproteobacteria bacterium]|nr:hypothetical protein [Deltaproteobacteria bacterium]